MCQGSLILFNVIPSPDDKNFARKSHRSFIFNKYIENKIVIEKLFLVFY